MELYATSEFYGAATIVKQFIGCPSPVPVPATIQHGWYHDAAVQGSNDLNGIQVWCWSSRIANALREIAPDRNIYAIGAPFLYQMQLLQADRQTNDRRRSGTIVFPCHSSEAIQVQCDYEQYADMLADLEDEFRPISVCVYYTDLASGYAETFRKRGFAIVCNGTSRRDSNFLSNFIDNTFDKRYALSNQMTSGLLYSSMLGLTSYVYGPAFEVKNAGNRMWDDIDQTKYHQQWIDAHKAFFSLESADLKQQRAFAESELGYADLRTRRSLRKLFLQGCFSLEYLSCVTRKVCAKR